MKKTLYVASGLLMVGLGTAGIFLPLLPTTPFLLLATYVFARSSRRMHDWLLTHRYLGPYIRAFRNKSGLAAGQKLRIGISFSVMMGISFYFAPITAVKWLVAVIWAFWTLMLVRMRTCTTPKGATSIDSAGPTGTGS